MVMNWFVLFVCVVALVVFEGCDASLLGTFRRMVGVEVKPNLAQVPPSPSPISDPNVVNPGNASTIMQKELPVPEVKAPDNATNTSRPLVLEGNVPGNTTNTNKPLVPEVKAPDSTMSSKTPPVPEDKVPETGQNEKQVNKDKGKDGIDEKCEPSSNMCINEKKNMIACLRTESAGSHDLFLLVQNTGGKKLKVNVVVPDFVKVSDKDLKVPKHKAIKVSVSTNVVESIEIVLNSGDGNCTLHIKAQVLVRVPKSNFFDNLPSYATAVTPLYGAYFMFAIVLVVGAGWACCKFGRKSQRIDGKVAYQELEMGTTGVDSTVNAVAADGWDDWDDDWDEEKPVKPQVGSVSANGLTSRSSSNKDGWDNNWDD